MSRVINLGAAQMGPIAPDESRESCVSRMVDLIKQASSRGCSFVVFPELALTTFFPRYYEEDISNSFPHEMPQMKSAEKPNYRNFDESAKKDFIEGAKVAYETIVTNFAKGSIKEIKNLLDRKVLNQFQEAISNREKNGIKSETTFIGINSAEIKNHEQKDNVLEVTVDFISEIISCNRDKNSKILTGDPEKVKKVYDTWRFSRNLNSNDPNWVLVETNV